MSNNPVALVGLSLVVGLVVGYFVTNFELDDELTYTGYEIRRMALAILFPILCILILGGGLFVLATIR
jgi:uncharacterized protein YneF (UPF0154 family)